MFLAISLRDRHDGTDRLQSFPATLIRKIFRQRADETVAVHFSSVSRIVAHVTTHFCVCKISIQVLREMGINAIVECGLISLHRKTVIGLQIDNRRSNFRLTSHGVNRNQSAVDLNQLQQFWNRSDLIALRVRDHLSKADMIHCGPRTHHVNGRFRTGCVITATQRFSINRDDLATCHSVQRSDPAEQTLFKLRWSQRTEHGVKPIVRRNPFRHIQKRAKPFLLCVNELRNSHKVISTADYSAQRHDDHVHQWIAWLASPRVGEF